MNDKKQENKELESMTDKVKEKEVKVDNDAMKNLDSSNQVAANTKILIPHDKDIEVLGKHFVSAPDTP